MGNLCAAVPTVTKVAVLGATGQQGGAVAAALAQKGIAVVAITRNPESEKAKALAEKPQIVVRKADLNDVASLVTAFEGCDGAFVIANFWEGMDAGKEMEQYKNAAEALKKVGTMKHVIFTTLEESNIPVNKDFKTIAQHATGDMKVPHFDGKARSEKFFEGLPTTFMVTSCYFENFTSFFSLAKQADGSYTFTLPIGDKKIPWTILNDLGVLVASTFQKPELVGERIGQASFYASGNDLAEMLTKATGKSVKYNKVDWKTFASFGFPGADELAQMFEFWNRTYDAFCGARTLDAQKAIIGGASFTDPVEYAKTLPLKFEG
ncbi:NMRAL1 [Symbiodinium natans]|uniref:NMRAL1 protein n=1 Tax=Symbiodinium natans TaxID=878477 RepID=A0A812SR87_9DINO|nr:NMRAL1 [Symbiodinium natans]